jgi:hypothetical protein
LVAVMVLAGCGNSNDPGTATGDQESDKSPLAEYMGEGFVSSAGGGMRMAIRAGRGGEAPSEEELAKQRKVEDATAACMKAAGFEYVPVPPESQPRSKFNDAFNLPPDKFAEQYGYGISTIDWSKAGADDSNPNTKIRSALSPNAQKAYDKALNGPNANGAGAIAIAPKEGEGPKNSGKMDLGCRGKAVQEVYGKGQDREAEFKKYDSLFKDIQALAKRIEDDQRVVDATTAWADCLAEAGQAGYKKIDEPRTKVSQKLAELSGNQQGGTNRGKPVIGAPSLDKVDAAKLAELRKFEIDLAVADQKCRAKVYDEPYKTVQYEQELEFVEQHKAELEAYRDGMASR